MFLTVTKVKPGKTLQIMALAIDGNFPRSYDAFHKNTVIIGKVPSRKNCTSWDNTLDCRPQATLNEQILKTISLKVSRCLEMYLMCRTVSPLPSKCE